MLYPASSGAPRTDAGLFLPTSLGIFNTVSSLLRRESRMFRNPGRFEVAGCLCVVCRN